MVVTHDLLIKATCIDLLRVKRGKYFRVVAEVIYDGKSLSQELIRRKLAVPYWRERKPITDWCN